MNKKLRNARKKHRKKISRMKAKRKAMMAAAKAPAA
jgi:hypothetical protein